MRWPTPSQSSTRSVTAWRRTRPATSSRSTGPGSCCARPPPASSPPASQFWVLNRSRKCKRLKMLNKIAFYQPLIFWLNALDEISFQEPRGQNVRVSQLLTCATQIFNIGKKSNKKCQHFKYGHCTDPNIHFDTLDHKTIVGLLPGN